MDQPAVLVAGVGNIFLGDDGFGSEVARRLAEQSTTPVAAAADAELSGPAAVRVVDYGIGGVHLAYDLLDGCDLLVLVDATSRDGAPGTLYLVEVDRDGVPDGVVDAHSMDPTAVFATLERLGGTLPRTLLVGCEPASTEEGIGLSDPVRAAVDVAAAMVRDLVARELGHRAGSTRETT